MKIGYFLVLLVHKAAWILYDLKFGNLLGMNLDRTKLRVRNLQLAITSKLQVLGCCKRHAHLRGKANYIDFLSQSQIYSIPLKLPKIP